MSQTTHLFKLPDYKPQGPAPTIPEEEQPQDFEEEAVTGEEGKGFKAFNLIGTRERQESARQQQKRIARMAAKMRADLIEEFKQINRKIVKAATSVDRNLVNYTIMHTVSKESDGLRAILKKYTEMAAKEFAGTKAKVKASQEHSLLTIPAS